MKRDRLKRDMSEADWIKYFDKNLPIKYDFFCEHCRFLWTGNNPTPKVCPGCGNLNYFYDWGSEELLNSDKVGCIRKKRETVKDA